MSSIACIAAVITMLLVSGIAYAGVVEVHHLMMGSWDQPFQDLMQQRKTAFEAQNPDIVVNLELFPGGAGAYVENLVLLAASGVSIDVMNMYPSVAGPVLSGGLAMDLRPMIERSDVDLSMFVPAGLEPFTGPNGEIYALPWETSPIVTLFNSNMFEESGLITPDQLESDWSWDLLYEKGRRLTRDTDGDGAPDVYGIEYRRDLLRVVNLIHQAGADLYDRTVNPAHAYFDSPEVEAAMDFYVNLFETNIAIDASQFLQGTSAINMHDSTWMIGNMEQAGRPFNWGVAVQPRGPVRGGGILFTSGHLVSSTSKVPQEAWEWVKFLTTEEESTMQYQQITGRISAFIPSAQRWMEVFPEAPDTISNYVAAVLDPDAFSETVSPVFSDIRSTFNSEIVAAMYGEEATRSVLSRIQHVVTGLLSQ